MDWATFFKEFPAAIPAITGILGILLGFFLNRWSEGRKRKWEIEDRQTKRQIEIWDKKITDAHAYLDEFFGAGRLVWTQGNDLIYTRNTVEHTRAHNEIQKLMDTVAPGSVQIALLNDLQLEELHSRAVEIYYTQRQKNNELFASISTNSQFDSGAFKKGLSEFNKDSVDLHRRMKKRLDELAQNPNK